MDPQATFLKRFGDLVVLLRQDPGNDAAQDLALTAAAAALVHGPVQIDVGIERGGMLDSLSLQGRLAARRIDAIQLEADVDVSELLALARALAHDTTPIPGSPRVVVVPFSSGPAPQVAPPRSSSPSSPARNSGPTMSTRRARPERRGGDDRRQYTTPVRWSGPNRRSGADRRATGERRLALVKNVQAESARLYGGLLSASRRHAWEETLYAVLALARVVPRVPLAERRAFSIQARRAVQRSVIEAIVDEAERDPAVRAAAVEVLCWLGLDAAEVLLDRLRAAPVLGPRGFFLDALGRIRGVYPMVAPLLRSTEPHHVRHGAAIAARLGCPEAMPLLVQHLGHPDEDVRIAAIHALGWLHGAPAGDALRASLRHPSPSTRAAAATAIAVWRGGALGVVLSAATATERDRHAWLALVDALGQIGTAAACATLGALARSRRSLVHRHGYTRDQRIAAVSALAQAGTPVAYRTLQALARDGDDDIRGQALGALTECSDLRAAAVS